MLNKALAIIHDEHRSLAAVIHGLRYVARELSQHASVPDFKLLGAMVQYIGAYPETIHHPKEERYLFARLRERTDAANETIATLERQHLEGSSDFALLQASLRDLEAGADGALPRFSAAVERMADNTWKHMNLEERSIIPLAKRYLTAEDWVEIAQAFGENGDPCFSAENDHQFRDLFSRIVNLAPPPIGIGPAST